MNDKWLVGWFVFCTLLALAILGVGIWGFIELVGWVTSQ